MAPRSASLSERIARFYKRTKEDPETGCLMWQGCVSRRGYGQVYGLNSKVVYAHRFVMEQSQGPIPPGYEVNHKCRVKLCVRVDHLEVITREEHCAKDRDIRVATGKRCGKMNTPAMIEHRKKLQEYRKAARERAKLCP